MVRLSFGPKGEFFVESHEPLSAENIAAFESLYRRITTARNECEIVGEAMHGMNDNCGER